MKILTFFTVIPAIFIFSLLCVSRVDADTKDTLQNLESDTIIYIGIEDTGSEWPPYEYFRRENGIKTRIMEGFCIDVLNDIFSQHGLKYEFREYPWKRCLRYLESGEKIQMVLPTSVSTERKAKYLISHRTYSITPSYFYMKKKYPDGLAITGSDELSEHRPVCGRLGFNYQNFGVENKIIEKGAITFNALIKKLKHGRCNVILARYEALAGHSLILQPLLTDDIGFAPIPDVPVEDFHFMITRKSAFSNELLQIINNGIDRLRSQGRLKEILRKYIR